MYIYIDNLIKKQKQKQKNNKAHEISLILKIRLKIPHLTFASQW